MQRLDYTRIQDRIKRLKGASAGAFFRGSLPVELCGMWCANYRARFPKAEIVSVPVDTFSYLFDLTDERNIAAYGLMGGKNTATRDHARMAGHPKGEGADYHRGHMIPHSGHGGTDINLFIQLGSVNVGPFRRLEKLAVANPGSFYFVHLNYAQGRSQRPVMVDQGLALVTPPSLDVEFFPN